MKKIDVLINVASFALAISMSAGILLFSRFLPERLPLFYSLPWGERQLASHLQFLIIPATAVLVTLINLTVKKQLHASQAFLKLALDLTSFIVTVILLITFLKIILIFI